MSWEKVDELEPADCLNPIHLLISRSHAYVMAQYDADHIYPFYFASDSLAAEVDIVNHNEYGLNYKPRGPAVLHSDGYLYSAKENLDIAAFYPAKTVSVVIAQVFRINPLTGALTKVLDTWEPYHCDKSYYISSIWTPCPPAAPVGWPDAAQKELDTGSSITSCSLMSYGGALHFFINTAGTKKNPWNPLGTDWEYYVDCCGLAGCLINFRYYYYNYENCRKYIHVSIDNGTSWTTVYEDMDGNRTPNGNAVHEVECGVSNDAGGGTYDTWLLSSGGTRSGKVWYEAVTGDADYIQDTNIYNFDQRYWRDINTQAQYKVNPEDAYALYYDYSTNPDAACGDTIWLPPVGFALDGDGDPIIAGTTYESPDVYIYYGKEYDDTITCDYDAIGDQEPIARPCTTFFGDYVFLSYSPEGEGCVLEVWKRDEPHARKHVVPVGMDISTGGSELYVTGTNALELFPFLINVDATSLPMASGFSVASGLSAYVPCTGWMYPHVGDFVTLYLYGYMGPYVKATQKIVTVAGVGDGIIANLFEEDYIGSLRTTPLWDSDDINFTVVSTSGHWFGRSVDGGDSYTNILATPWPAVSMYRAILYEKIVVGSGMSSFIGASGTYDCPVRLTIDYEPLAERCDGLPTYTITDIEGHE